MTDDLEALLRSAKTELATRITLATRRKLDGYLDWRQTTAEAALPAEAINWPSSVTDVVEEALLDWLAVHQIKRKTGPVDPHVSHPRPKLQPKQRKED